MSTILLFISFQNIDMSFENYTHRFSKATFGCSKNQGKTNKTIILHKEV